MYNFSVVHFQIPFRVRVLIVTAVRLRQLYPQHNEDTSGQLCDAPEHQPGE